MSRLHSGSHADIGRGATKGIEGEDKTNYGIIPTSPSPTQLSPTLTESTSNSASNSSNSPPQPATPLRNRPRTRYPELGRVPLHRRGTSKKYETMEDLLREAGYKETRIFTPESERSESHRNVNGSTEDKRLTMKDGMEAVVGFFAGLIPSATSNKSSLEPTTEESGPRFTTSPQEYYSPPLSPLAQRYAQRSATLNSIESTEPSTPTNITSSIESLRDPTPKAASRQHISRSNSPAPTINHPAYYQQQPPLIIRNSSHNLQKQPSRNSINRPSNNNIVSPRPSRAGAYLRHMSSVQSMPSRPNSTPVHLFARPRAQLDDNEPRSTQRRRGNGEGEEEGEPPLPPSWLETVARAVLFGGTGAYVGGPANFAVPDQQRHASGSGSNSPRPPRIQVLRPTRSSLSQTSRRPPKRPAMPRSGLSDSTNVARASSNSAGLLIPPPPLFSMIERGRAGRSEGEVTKTRVMCRSAPGSRSGSMVRGSLDDKREKHKDRGRDKRKGGQKDRLPSLARTQTEGDIWSRRPQVANKAPVSVAGRYMSGWGAGVESEDDDANADNDDDPLGSSSESNDEGELNLARIIIPPKRQNSIKSLRKHLASDHGGGGDAQGTLKAIAGAIIPTAGRSGRSGVNVVSRGPPSVGQHSFSRTGMGWLDGIGDSTTSYMDGEATQEWGAGWVRRGRGRGSYASEDDDDMESFMGFGVGAADSQTRFGSGRSSSGKRSSGFTVPWGLSR